MSQLGTLMSSYATQQLLDRMGNLSKPTLVALNFSLNLADLYSAAQRPQLALSFSFCSSDFTASTTNDEIENIFFVFFELMT